MRLCLDCKKRIPGGSRCEACRSVKGESRSAYKAQRYNAEYRATRARYASLISSGVVFNCARCLQPIKSKWHLDHLPDGRLRPSHARCNVVNNQDHRKEPVKQTEEQ